jgi:hypothetical protein
MPRQGRVVVPNWPHRVIQRGQLTGGERFIHAVAKRVRWGSSFGGEGGPGKVTHTSVPFLSARLYVLASHDKSSGLCNGLRSDLIVWV